MQIDIDYKFRDPNLLQLALTHPSWAKKKMTNTSNANKHYERLEFLGDSVLSMAIADIIYNKYTDLLEGPLSVIHANLVNTRSIASIAESINLGQALIMDHGEEAIGGRQNQRNLENAMEALIGAIYLDSSYERVKQFIEALWAGLLSDPGVINKNHKSILQEWSQKYHKVNPDYVLETRDGEAHSPTFSISVNIPGLEPVVATGKSKKEAEQKAAAFMLEKIADLTNFK